MKNKLSVYSPALPFYLLTAGVFLIIVCRDILSNGMFLDGLIYSTVSRNMAEGIGTFWNPQFTVTCIPDFHEHPPLAFGIQSIYYSLLGQGRLIDRLYSLLTVFTEAIIILKIWKTLGHKNGWIVLMMWLITPTVFWTSYNNLLENTLTIFTSLSVLCYIKFQENNKIYLLFTSGVLLSLGFLTKGFVSFFPWIFPLCLWLFRKRRSFIKMSADTLVIFLSTVVPLLLLVLISPVARLSLHKYIDNQVIYSIRNIVTVKSRFDIVLRMINEIAPLILLYLLFLLAGRIMKLPVIKNKVNTATALSFVALALSGVFPIMVSMKQSGFYILPVYPFFAIAAAIFLIPYTDELLARINYSSGGYIFFRWLAVAVFLVGIFLSVSFSGGYSRDEIKLKDIRSFLDYVPAGSVINIDPQMYEDWSLHGYCERFKHVSLDPDSVNKRDFLLIKKEYYNNTLDLKYKEIKTMSANYLLFRRI
jgi:4-amino-4-deoxy-L-arabinose transferase-like glycosyltransferase